VRWNPLHSKPRPRPERGFPLSDPRASRRLRPSLVLKRREQLRGFLSLSVHRRAPNQAASHALLSWPCVAQRPPHSITLSALMEVETLFVAAGDNVISPLPVALVEGRRRARWYPPGTTDTLGARKAKVLHQVNQALAQSKIRRHPVDRFYARHFDLRQRRCLPDRRRLLRVRRERPRDCRAAEERDERAASHVWMAPVWQEIIWRAAQRSLAVMCPACWCSPGGLLALMESANRVLIIQTGSMSR
jgi:hypothetical protein